jgi:hypothetical protein
VLQLNQLDVVCVAGFVATSNVETVNDVRYVLMTPSHVTGLWGSPQFSKGHVLQDGMQL